MRLGGFTKTAQTTDEGSETMGDIEKDFSHLANALLAQRLKLGLTRQHLANRVGRTAEDIEAIESGRLKYELGTVFLICDELGLNFRELCDKSQSEQADSKLIPFPEVRKRQ